MNAVWLSDELMVSPSAVAGLRAAHVTSGNPPTWSYVVDVLFVGGSQARVAEVVEKAAAVLEMARLSELLWPSPIQWCTARTESFPMGRMDFGRCVLELGHDGDHDFR